jgi:G3E family GTPase
LASPAQLSAVRGIVRSHNCKARIIETTNSEIDPREILDTKRFSFEAAHRFPNWFKEVNKGYHKPETEEYRISSFVYQAREPFVPEKLHAFFSKPWPGVVRAKGFFWLATRPQWIGELSQAGSLIRHQWVGRWWGAIPRKNWPKDEGLIKRVTQGWHAVWGDRRQELVFIGIDMDKAAIKAELDACLLRPQAAGLSTERSWSKLADPFPDWTPPPAPPRAASHERVTADNTRH